MERAYIKLPGDNINTAITIKEHRDFYQHLEEALLLALREKGYLSEQEILHSRQALIKDIKPSVP